MGGIAEIYEIGKTPFDFSGKDLDPDRMRAKIKHRGSLETIRNKSGSLKVAFNGKLFNKKQLFNELKNRHGFFTGSDAEITMHLFEEEKEKCVRRMEGVFAFAVSEWEEEGLKELFIARDPLGIVPLYISENGNRVCIASEVKAFSEVADDYFEFPIGSYYHVEGRKKSEKKFFKYSTIKPCRIFTSKCEDVKPELVRLLRDGVKKRLEPRRPVGVYLSGGLDSSIVAALIAEEQQDAISYAVGMEGSHDIRYARLCAEHLGLPHREYIYSIEEMTEILPKVIYHLESFDAALVRSAIPNYFLAKMVSKENEIVFSGEGADELFCGYRYMQKLTSEESYRETLDLLESLHKTGLQRGDRIAAAFGLEVRFPFLDLDFVRFALQISPLMKLGPSSQEKWILRKAFGHMLPEVIAERKKEKFSAGAGSSEVFVSIANKTISDEEFSKNCMTKGGHRLKNKEELFYYKIFLSLFQEKAAERTVGFSRSL